jgi:hypothetical protein
MGELDKETKAIAEIAATLGGLDDEDQRGRVVRYIAERFNVEGGKLMAKKTQAGALELRDEGQFSDFATLYNACGPNTDALRALVAGYWLQICQSAQGFDGQSANTELKNLGHGVKNITAALSALKDQKPVLVLQVKKSGKTKQARKLYKLTAEGINRVRAMISGNGDAE